MNDKYQDEDTTIDHIRAELEQATPSTRRRIIEKFILAALGSIPWVGGFISALAEMKLEKDEIKQDSLQSMWLEEHRRKLELLSETLNGIGTRFESLGSEIEERIQDEKYLDLVRRAFRVWDRADTDEKRKYVSNLVTNASATTLCSDDIIRLFIDWLDLYHEAHFAVIREIYQHPRCTRYDIWMEIYGELTREDAAEADLFRKLVRDLSTGGVIRQERATTGSGDFLKAPRQRTTGYSSRTMVSSFDNKKRYVLTELGKQFVHYTMNEVVIKIESGEENK